MADWLRALEPLVVTILGDVVDVEKILGRLMKKVDVFDLCPLVAVCSGYCWLVRVWLGVATLYIY